MSAARNWRRWRVLLRTVAMLVAVAAATGCDLVPFNEAGTTGARSAESLTHITSFEVRGIADSLQDGALPPEGFIPDYPGAVSGYLLRETHDTLLVWRVDDRQVRGLEEFALPDTRRAFRWIARVVPGAPPPGEGASEADGGALPPEPLIPAPLVVGRPAVEGDGVVTVEVIYAVAEAVPDDTDETGDTNGTGNGGVVIRVERRPLDLSGILAANTPFGTPEVLAFQMMAEAGSPSVVEIQLLARDGDTGGAVREFFIRWDLFTQQDPSAPLVYTFQAGNNAFLLPQRTDERRATAISYGNIPGDTGRRGFLTFADGDFRGAPLKTYTWPTETAGVVPQPVEEWQERVAAVSSTGVIRSALNGFTALIIPEAPEGARRSTKDYGTLWYAGEFPKIREGEGEGEGEPGDAVTGGTLRSLYSAVGYSESFRTPRVFVGVYQD